MWVPGQPSLGIALPALEREAPRKGGVEKACPNITWLDCRDQRVFPLMRSKIQEKFDNCYLECKDNARQ